VKRKINIILLLWGIFSFIAILVTFQEGVRLEKKHVVLIELNDQVKSEFFQSRIYWSQFLLSGDTSARYPLNQHLQAAGEFLEDMVPVSGINPFNTDSASPAGFVRRIPRIRECLRQIGVLFVNNYSGSGPDMDQLSEAFLNYNMQFREFERELHQYLTRQNHNYKIASFSLILISFITLVLSFIFISRLMKTLSSTEQRLVEKTVETEQKERHRIATELHDGLGSLLSSIHLYLKILEAEMQEGKDVTERVVYLKQLSDLSLQNVRSVVNNLEPLFLKKYGLIVSMHRMCQRMNKIEKISFELHADDFNLSLSKSTEMILFRIFSELVNNALKHSRASMVRLMLKNVRQQVYFRYEDDGIGFDPEEILRQEEGKLGLKNIISRIESLGGTQKIISAPGKGLNIYLQFRTTQGRAG